MGVKQPKPLQMSVSKRNGSKYFYIQFQYNGRTYIKSSKTPDKQLALNLEAQWRKQLIEQNQLGLKSPIEITKGFQLFIKSKSHIKSIKYTIHWCDKGPSIKFTVGLTLNLYQFQIGTPWKPLFSGLSGHGFLAS